MKCPKCENDVHIKLTRQNHDDNETYRLRKCKVCGHQFYTVEFEVEDNEIFREAWNNCV